MNTHIPHPRPLLHTGVPTVTQVSAGWKNVRRSTNKVHATPRHPSGKYTHGACQAHRCTMFTVTHTHIAYSHIPDPQLRFVARFCLSLPLLLSPTPFSLSLFGNSNTPAVKRPGPPPPQTEENVPGGLYLLFFVPLLIPPFAFWAGGAKGEMAN